MTTRLNWPKDCVERSIKPIHRKLSEQLSPVLEDPTMHWENEKMKRRLQVTGFLVLLLGGAAFLAVTDNDEGPSLWQRWTNSSSLRARGAQDSLLKQIATIDLPRPKGNRFHSLRIAPSLHPLFPT